MTEIEMTQDVSAPVEALWRAWTTTEGLARWWWPQLPDTTYAFEARVGGSYRFASAAAGIGVHGEVVRLEEPHLLELTWVWEDGAVHAPAEQVVVELTARPGGSRVSVRHTVADPAGAEDFRQGWTDCLARLEAKV